MKRILCYGDSNTYGLSPDWAASGPARFDEGTRWPCVLQALLGDEYRVIEEGLNGRTTVFDDPTAPGRRGLDFIGVCVESHAPLELVILMLGTNDTKSLFSAPPFLIAEGMRRVAEAAMSPGLASLYPAPKVLIAAPCPIGKSALGLADGITDLSAIEKSKALAGFYEKVASRLGCGFLDLAAVAETSEIDGVHLSAKGHRRAAEAFEKKVREMLA